MVWDLNSCADDILTACYVLSKNSLTLGLTQPKLVSNLLCSQLGFQPWTSGLRPPKSWDYRSVPQHLAYTVYCLLSCSLRLAECFTYPHFATIHLLHARHIQCACHLISRQLLPYHSPLEGKEWKAQDTQPLLPVPWLASDRAFATLVSMYLVICLKDALFF